MLEYTEFRGWYYGTLLQSLSQQFINVGVFNPEGIRSLLKHQDEISLYIFRLKTSDKERVLRQLLREKNPDVKEIVRRFTTDEQDFSNLNFDYITLPNERFEDIDPNIEFIIKTVREDKNC